MIRSRRVHSPSSGQLNYYCIKICRFPRQERKRNNEIKAHLQASPDVPQGKPMSRGQGHDLYWFQRAAKTHHQTSSGTWCRTVSSLCTATSATCLHSTFEWHLNPHYCLCPEKIYYFLAGQVEDILLAASVTKSETETSLASNVLV